MTNTPEVLCACDHALHRWCGPHWRTIPGLHRAKLCALMGPIGKPATKAYLRAAKAARKTLEVPEEQRS